jgi:hypothetical protein
MDLLQGGWEFIPKLLRLEGGGRRLTRIERAVVVRVVGLATCIKIEFVNTISNVGAQVVISWNDFIHVAEFAHTCTLDRHLR